MYRVNQGSKEDCSNKEEGEFTEVINTRILKKKAIPSYSIIVYTLIRGEIHYLIAKLRDTIAFKEYIKCTITKDNILKYANNMSKEEKNRILTESFHDLVDDVLINHAGRTYRATKQCEHEFMENVKRDRAILKDDTIGLKETPWMFPKGRRQEPEPELVCALREFEEETRISSSNIKPVDIDPFEETYFGLDNQLYKTVYFLGHLPYSDYVKSMSMAKKQYIKTRNRVSLSEEVSTIKWEKYEDASEKLDNPKKYILRSINTYLIFSLPCKVRDRRNSL